MKDESLVCLLLFSITSKNRKEQYSAPLGLIFSSFYAKKIALKLRMGRLKELRRVAVANGDIRAPEK